MAATYLDAEWSDDGLHCSVVLTDGRRVQGAGPDAAVARRDLGRQLTPEVERDGRSVVVRSHPVDGSSQMVVMPDGQVVDLPDPPDAPDSSGPAPGVELVRVDHSDDDSWWALLAELTRPSEDGFVPVLTVVDDPVLDGATPEQVVRVRQLGDAPVVFLADTAGMAVPRSVLAVRQRAGRVESFRVAAGSVWAVENNLSLANMDWAEFADAAGGGVFQDFGPV